MINQIEGCNDNNGTSRPDNTWYLPEREFRFARLSDINLGQLALILCFLNPVSATVEVSLLAKLASNVIKLFTFFELTDACWISVGVPKCIQFSGPLLNFLISTLGQHLSMMVVEAILSPLSQLLFLLLILFLVLLFDAGFEPFQICNFDIHFVDPLKAILIQHSVLSFSLHFFIVTRKLRLCTSTLEPGLLLFPLPGIDGTNHADSTAHHLSID